MTATHFVTASPSAGWLTPSTPRCIHTGNTHLTTNNNLDNSRLQTIPSNWQHFKSETAGKKCISCYTAYPLSTRTLHGRKDTTSLWHHTRNTTTIWQQHERGIIQTQTKLPMYNSQPWRANTITTHPRKKTSSSLPYISDCKPAKGFRLDQSC